MTGSTHADTTWVCEIVGPPGVGKSTVIDAIARGHDARTRASLKAAGPRLVTSAIAVVARALGDRASRPRTWQEFRWMTRLSAAGALVNGPCVVFDQGPVYTIARLTGVSIRGSAWLDGQVRRWSTLMDLIVLLDAPDDALVERIHGRSKTHQLKGKGEREVRESLARWRSLYAAVVADMTAGQDAPALARIDTTAVSPSDAAAQIIARADRSG